MDRCFYPNNKGLPAIYIVIGAFCAALLIFNFAAVIIALSGLMAGFLLISKAAQAEEHRTLSRIFIAALLSKLAAAALFYFLSISTGGDGFFVMDDGVDASYNGWVIAKLWRMGVSSASLMIRHSCPSSRLGPYHFWNGFVYYFTGWNPLVMFFISCVLGALTVILIYLIAREIFNKKVAQISAWLFAFWPSVFLWSTMNSKEPPTIFFICLAVWSFLKIRQRFRIGYLAGIAVSVFVLHQFRQIVSAVLVVSMLFSFLLLLIASFDRRGLFFRFAAAAVVIGAVFLIKINFVRIENRVVETLGGGNTIVQAVNYTHNIRSERAQTAFLPNVDISRPLNMLIFFPFGLFHVIFSPFPWNISSSLQLMALPEMLLWYGLLPFIFRGILIALRYRWRQSLIVFTFILFMASAMALLEGNVGTIFRHRSFITGFCLIFAVCALPGNLLCNGIQPKLNMQR